jgi:hypothetical protein
MPRVQQARRGVKRTRHEQAADDGERGRKHQASGEPSGCGSRRRLGAVSSSCPAFLRKNFLMSLLKAVTSAFSRVARGDLGGDYLGQQDEVAVVDPGVGVLLPGERGLQVLFGEERAAAADQPRRHPALSSPGSNLTPAALSTPRPHQTPRAGGSSESRSSGRCG